MQLLVVLTRLLVSGFAILCYAYFSVGLTVCCDSFIMDNEGVYIMLVRQRPIFISIGFEILGALK